MPKKLKHELIEYEVSTVFENGWSGKKNGELMNLLIKNNFDVFLTFDKNLRFQQNFKKYKVKVFVLSAKDNTYNTLKEIIPQLKKKLNQDLPFGSFEIVL